MKQECGGRLYRNTTHFWRGFWTGHRVWRSGSPFIVYFSGNGLFFKIYQYFSYCCNFLHLPTAITIGNTWDCPEGDRYTIKATTLLISCHLALYISYPVGIWSYTILWSEIPLNTKSLTTKHNVISKNTILCHMSKNGNIMVLNGYWPQSFYYWGILK